MIQMPLQTGTGVDLKNNWKTFWTNSDNALYHMGLMRVREDNGGGYKHHVQGSPSPGHDKVLPLYHRSLWRTRSSMLSLAADCLLSIVTAHPKRSSSNIGPSIPPPVPPLPNTSRRYPSHAPTPPSQKPSYNSDHPHKIATSPPSPPKTPRPTTPQAQLRSAGIQAPQAPLAAG